MSVKLKWDILKMRFEDINEQFKQRSLSCEEAALLLGMSPRTFLRKRNRYEENEFDGRYDRRIGRPSNNRAMDEETEALTKLYETRYRGFSVKHFHEHYVKEVEKPRSYNWSRSKLHEAGLVRKSKRGGPHRRRRERKPMQGMMLHQDASTHLWIEDLGYCVDLIATLDDATSEVTSCFLAPQEGTVTSLQGIKETILKKGVFCSFYTDRGSHYAYTPEAGGKVDKSRLTQVGRALKELGIQHIHAYSPEARGRSERMFGTLQGRLPQELTLHGIKTMEEANEYIQEVYLPAHNARFSKAPSDPKTAYVKWTIKERLDELLCIKEKRVVQKDNTVRYENKILQIPQQEHRYHYVKSDVEVREYLDKSLAIFFGHMCLGRYDQVGNLIAVESKKREEVKAA
jgi:transposase